MSLQAFVSRLMLRYTFRRRLAKNPTVEYVRMMNSIAEAGLRMKTGMSDVKIESRAFGGVAVELLSREGADASRAILYIHGGAWITGSPQTHRSITRRLVRLTGVPVCAVDYRLAPEHPWPAALDDCTGVWDALARELSPSNIAVAGDSAGGNLTLALAMKLKAEGKPLPAALVCLSPVTDLTGSGASYKTNARADVLFTPDLMGKFAPLYVGDADIENPLVSPLFGDPAGLPPTLFQVAGTEILLDDSVRMAEKMRASGVDVTLDVRPGLWHVWHLSASRLPEGVQALAKVAEFLRRHLGQNAMESSV